LVDRELEQCVEPDREDELRAERSRLTALLTECQGRLRSIWVRARFEACHTK
jgi:hypothetical protein